MLLEKHQQHLNTEELNRARCHTASDYRPTTSPDLRKIAQDPSDNRIRLGLKIVPETSH